MEEKNKTRNMVINLIVEHPSSPPPKSYILWILGAPWEERTPQRKLCVGTRTWPQVSRKNTNNTNKEAAYVLNPRVAHTLHNR